MKEMIDFGFITEENLQELGEEIELDENINDINTDEANLDGIEEGETENEEVIDIPDESFRQLRSHKDPVYSISVNPHNFDIVASGGGDDVAYIWDLSKPDPVTPIKLSGHTDSVVHVAFSFDGSLLATGGLDGVTKIWNPQNGSLLHNLEGPDSVECLDWHPKGPVLFAGGSDGVGWMWNASNGKVMTLFTGHSDIINEGKFTPDGKKIITCSSDRTIRIWDPKSAVSTHVIQEGSSSLPFHQEGIVTFAYSKDEESDIFVSGSTDGLACIFNSSSGKQIANYKGHKEGIESIDFVAGFSFVATGSLDKTIKIWDLTTQQTRVTMNHDDGIVKVHCPKNQPYILYSCSLDGTIRCWDCRTGESVNVLKGNKSHVLDFQVLVESKLLVSAGEDNVIRVWKL